jgi:LmbE family N-acetylglucosaminyl deacetylase
MRKLLCVVAHPDDEVLGCGATLSRAACEGVEVRVLLPIQRSDLRGMEHWSELTDQYNRAVSHLGGRAFIAEPMIREEGVEANTMRLHALVEPFVEWCDVVLTHWGGDVHQAHRAVARAVEIATRPFRRRRDVLHFEVPTSTDQSFQDTFLPNFFVMLKESDVQRKIEAFSFYGTETAPGRDAEGLIRRLRLRGAQINSAFAEAFFLSRAFV